MAKEEDKGSKVIATATRVAGERTARLTKSAMAKKKREVGEEEWIGRGSESNGYGKEDSDGKQR